MQADNGVYEINNYYDNSHAIIIGISKYKIEPTLSNAVNDAKAIQKVLEQKYNFKTTTALFNEDATQKSITEIFVNMFTDETKIGPKDRVIIYYSGHGKLRTFVGPNGQIIKTGYIIPYDFESDNFALAIPMQTIVGACQVCFARHTLLILDCCYSGIAATRGDVTKPRRVTSRYLDHIARKRAIQLLAAGEEDEPVADSGVMPGYSAFTGALLSILEPEVDPDEDGILTASEIGAALKHQVALQESGFFQNPVYTNITGHENGDFVFKIFNRDITDHEVSRVSLEDIDSLVESARDYFSDGLYEKALECIDNALKINRDLYSAHDLRGSILSALGKYNEAIASFDEALRIKPDYHRALINKGITLIRIEDIEKAQKVFDLVIALNPNNASGWYYRGIVLRAEHKYKEAIHSFEKARRIRPNYLEALNAKESALAQIEGEKEKYKDEKPDKPSVEVIAKECTSLLSKGAYVEANKCYDEVLKIDETLINVWHNKGLALINLRLYDEAIKCFERAARKDRDTSDSYYKRALWSYSMGRFNDAVKDFKKVINLNPNESEAWKFIGHILHDNLYNYSEAKKCYDHAISINPNQPDVWYNKARILSKLGKYGEAIEYYNKATGLNPNYAEAWNNKGNVFHKLKRYREAIESFDRAVTINPNDAKIWYNRGNAFLYLKNPQLIDSHMSVTNMYETAIEYYNKATGLNPNYAEAWNNKGLALKKLGRNHEAKACLNKAEKLHRKG